MEEKVKTKKVKRKRLNIARTLVFILILYIIVCAAIYVYKAPVKHYEISGNYYLTDADILRELKLKDYPAFVSINAKKKARKLKENYLVKEAKISYGWNFTIKIEVDENDPLFIEKSTNQIYLEDGRKIDNTGEYVGIPMLLNTTPEEVLKLLATNLAVVDKGTLYMISEIQYAPSYNSKNQVIDENRFLLSMSDHNLVYITAKKAKLLNKYLDVIATNQITGNGTLYLDGDEDRYSFKLFDSTSTIKKEEVEEVVEDEH